MTTLAQLTTPLTVEEVKASIYAGLATSGVTTSTWKPGAVVRTIVAVLSVVLAAFSSLTAAIARGGFLELATGDWLTLVARSVFSTDRLEGTFATGFVTITNAAGGVFTGVGVGDLIVRGTNGMTYRNTAVFSLGAGPSSVVVPIQADELGSASTAAAATITSFVTPFVGCSVTNAAALLGTDVELDPALRARARERTGILSPNGPKDAYAYVAKSAKRDGTAIGVTRVRAIADGMGGVDVYVADADGTITGTVGDLDTDLGVIDRDIQENAVPLAVTARVHAATPLTIPVTYEAWVRDTSGLSNAEIEELVGARLEAFFADQPIGGEVIAPAAGKVYDDAVYTAIGDTLIDDVAPVIKLVLSLPSGDVTVGQTEAPVVGVITATIHQVNARGLS